MLMAYPPAKKDNKYTVKNCYGVMSYSFSDCKYLKKLYFDNDKIRLSWYPFSNVKGVSVYLPKNINNNRNHKLVIFDNTCRKCIVYVRKGASHIEDLKENASDIYKIRYW